MKDLNTQKTQYFFNYKINKKSKHITEEVIQMKKKHMKRCSKLYTIRE